MHQLHRGVEPTCLCHYDYRTDKWVCFSEIKMIPKKTERDDIQNKLESMQGRLCAYCECDLDSHGQHIEHFRQRSRYPQGTFEWDNLFLSCKRENSCGKYKDKIVPYNHLDLIKPDEEDPEHFFHFIADGTIELRQDLTPSEQHRARETLRIFNLDAQGGSLRHMRKRQCMGYVQIGLEIQEMTTLYPPEDWLPFLEDELEKALNLPFFTAIRHTLTPMSIDITTDFFSE